MKKQLSALSYQLSTGRDNTARRLVAGEQGHVLAIETAWRRSVAGSWTVALVAGTCGQRSAAGAVGADLAHSISIARMGAKKM